MLPPTTTRVGDGVRRIRDRFGRRQSRSAAAAVLDPVHQARARIVPRRHAASIFTDGTMRSYLPFPSVPNVEVRQRLAIRTNVRAVRRRDVESRRGVQAHGEE
jgi:hypothetical protein